MLRFVGQKHYADARKALWSVPEPDAIRQQIAFHRLKAAISSGLGEPQNAVLEMRAALKLSPRDSKLSLATAVAEMQAGQFEDALERARNSGSSSTALAIVGDIEDKRGEYEAAAGAYQAAVALAPGQEAYRIALAERTDSASNIQTGTGGYSSRPDIEQSYYNIEDDRFLSRPLPPYPLAGWAEFSYQGVPVRVGQDVQTVKRITARELCLNRLPSHPQVK